MNKINTKLNGAKAVIYARYSSDMQHETSIEAQLNASYEYAKLNGMTVCAEYIDRAKSGTTTAKRDEFNKMISDSDNKQFEYVIVHKLDRFARDRYDSAIAKHELAKNGVKVLSVLEHIDNTPESIILEALLEALSEYYSRNLAREVMKGFMVKASKCLHNGGIPPLGYDLNPSTKMLVINEKEAEIVRLIFDLYIKGYGYGTIISFLNSKGYRTKLGNEFGKNSLHDLLMNKKYAGYYMYNTRYGKGNRHLEKDDDEVICIKGGVPAIITEETFNKAAEIMKSHKIAPGANSAKQPYLLSGIIRCGHCGCKMSGNARKNGNGYFYRSYRCEHKVSCECDNKEIRVDKVDEFVLSQLEKYIFSEENLPVIMKSIQDNSSSNSIAVKEELKSMKDRLSGIDKKRNNIINAISEGYSNADFKEKLEQLGNDKEALIQRITELENSEIKPEITIEDLRLIIGRFSQYVRERNIPECRRFVKQFVEEVVVYNNKVEVTLRVASSLLCGNEYTVTRSIGRTFLPTPSSRAIAYY